MVCSVKPKAEEDAVTGRRPFKSGSLLLYPFMHSCLGKIAKKAQCLLELVYRTIGFSGVLASLVHIDLSA